MQTSDIRRLISAKALLPGSDLITRRTVASDLAQMLKSQYWSRDQLVDYQNLQLRKLVRHCYDNVPFYRILMQEAGVIPTDVKSISDLHVLPIVTKDDLRKAGKKHIAVEQNPRSYIQHSSSGSTGEPFQFYKSLKSDSLSKAAALRAWNWHGYNLGDRYVKISMNPRHSRIKRIQDYINSCLYVSSNQLEEKSFGRILDLITKFDPKFIRGYPIPMQMLASLVEKATGRYLQQSLKGINTTGSTLSNPVRDKIEYVFGVKMFDSYSCEGGSNFTQCPDCGYYHPSEEYAISEFVEDDYSREDPDHPLRHITTDLSNYATPFLRYDTQDYLVVANVGESSCKKPFQSIRMIKGRDSDVLVTPSRKYLIVENFVAYFEYIKEVLQIQVVQKAINRIEINLLVDKYFTANQLHQISGYWKSYIGDDVNVDVRIVDSIELTPTGKRRTLIRDSMIKLND